MSAIVSHGGIMPPQGLTGNVGTKGLDPLSGKFRQLGRVFLLMAGPRSPARSASAARHPCFKSAPLGARAANAAATLIFARGSEYRPS
jgi:hypothetical protein